MDTKHCSSSLLCLQPLDRLSHIRLYRACCSEFENLRMYLSRTKDFKKLKLAK